jgi:hypothetical protein
MSYRQTFFPFSQDMQGMWPNAINMPIVPCANYHACEALLLRRRGVWRDEIKQ